MCAGTVVAPPGETSAGIVSVTSRSRSVALRPSFPFSARSSRLARIGIVLRRSTTRCTCPIDLRSAARSTVTFMSRSPTRRNENVRQVSRRGLKLTRRRGFGKGAMPVMPGLVPGIHAFLYVQDVDGPGVRAFTPVFDGLCPAMTQLGGFPVRSLLQQALQQL